MKTLLTPLCFLVGLLLPGQEETNSEPQEATSRGQGNERRARGASSRTPRVSNLSRTVLEGYFDVGDYNSDGFISFREARKSLAVSRAGFARYDTDRNGLIDLEEFTSRYTLALVAGDSLPEPIPDRGPPKEPTRTAPQLRLAFDANADGVIDLEELTTTLTAYERDDLDPGETLERLDIDGSGVLELSELDGLSPLLFATDSLGLVEQDTPEERVAESKIKTLSDLFGERVIRKSETNAADLPPQIVGPLDHFRRLDFNDDGVISQDDLDSLMRPIQSTIRLNAVVATLDRDEDGVVSRDEFWSAMED